VPVLRFFRLIRQRLITENRVSRYLLYALGEILLVVIGILIALQVNNWNEERKQRQVEKKYFFNLKNDLYTDIERLEYMMGISQTKVEAAKKIKQNADQDSVGSLFEFSKDMMDLIFVDEFRPNQNTYEEMKSSGNFSSMRNDSLKLRLINLKKAYTEIGQTQEHMRNDFEIFLEDIEHYIDMGKYYDLSKSDLPNMHLAFDSLYVISNSERMKAEVRDLFRNKVFLNNIFLVEINYAYNIQVLKDTKSEILDIINILDQELHEE
jgi:hypothetical protein